MEAPLNAQISAMFYCFRRLTQAFVATRWRMEQGFGDEGDHFFRLLRFLA